MNRLGRGDVRVVRMQDLTPRLQTPVETLSLDDVENAVKLLVAATGRLAAAGLTPA